MEVTLQEVGPITIQVRQDGFWRVKSIESATRGLWTRFIHDKRTEEFMEAFSRKHGTSAESMLSQSDGDLWVVPALGMEFAQRSSASFAVWQNGKIADIIFPSRGKS